MFDVKKVRRTLIWSTPLFLGIAASCVLVTWYALIPAVQGVASLAPAVRIAPAAQLTPFTAFTCLMVIAMGAMRAIPTSDSGIKKFERFLTYTVLLNTLVLVLIPVTSVAQRFYMPSVGYSMCSELQGNPTMWFTDWVRDPAWCVKGKSLEWVNEQRR
ncbi:hypothetical protein [Paracidovorax valerianellae]|nr:hypothetical protein [Paracidovorax valerianellae]MDA8444856.1 hypothetical protein [Paracidovorax valerianellae]